MAIKRQQKNQSEVAVVLTVNITDIFKVSDNEDKANTQTENEIKRLVKALQKVSGVDNVEVQKTKIFPNIKGADVN